MSSFLIALVFFTISLILTIIFCFSLRKDILWLLGVIFFTFGMNLSDDTLVTFFASCLFALVLLLLGKKAKMLYGLAIVYCVLSSFYIMGAFTIGILVNVFLVVFL